MNGQTIYQGTILLLLVVGLVTAVSFIGQHRPRQWRKLPAWDASGWVIIVAAVYLRSLILIVSRWPGAPPQGWLDATFAIGSLLALDIVLLIRVVNYRSFRDQDAIKHGGENVIT